ncbi:hypothetical protein HG531_009791 [Fusarium graminearum]|nr:hypothetical protein HG531_009791 [Fusarium graminearum]
MVIRIGVEKMSEEHGVLVRSASPHLPKFIAEGILNKLVRVVSVVDIIVRIDIDGHGVDVLRSVMFLGRQETHVFTPEVATKCSRMVTSLVGLSIHHTGDQTSILHDDTQFTVVITELASVVEVTATTNCDTVVHQKQFTMDIKLFLDPILDL